MENIYAEEDMYAPHEVSVEMLSWPPELLHNINMSSENRSKRMTLHAFMRGDEVGESSSI